MTDRQHLGIGEQGESLAASHLASLGMRIIAHRHRTRLGEIDLICRDGNVVVFVEVKTRSSDRAGAPFEAVTPAKQRQLTRLALAYLKSHGLLDQPARFDVVGVRLHEPEDTGRIDYYRNAFPAADGDCLF